jgi:antitoxin HicB
MKKSKANSRRIGSSFDQFLDEHSMREEVDAVAQKRVIAWQIQEAMRTQGLTKTTMAERMATSRAALDRLLDPENAGVTLTTMSRAAAAVGAHLTMKLVPLRSARTASAKGGPEGPLKRRSR